MLKKILFTHDDLDGAGSRVIFELAQTGLVKGTDYDVLNCSNTGLDKSVLNSINKEDYIGEDTHIYFADITPSNPVALELVKRYGDQNVFIFDHHPTAFPVTSVIPGAIIIPENPLGKMESGTSLLYHHLCELGLEPEFINDDWSCLFVSGNNNSRLLSEFVDTIRSYDTYEFKETGNIMAKKMQILYSLLGMDRFCNRYVKKFTDGNSEDLISEVDAEFVNSKMEFEQKVIDNLSTDDIYPIELMGYRACLMIKPVYANISEVAYQFLKKNPQFDIFVSFSFVRNGEFSFRTLRDDINLGIDIAKPIGGGGHPKAAGSPLPEWLRDNFINHLMFHVNRVNN